MTDLTPTDQQNSARPAFRLGRITAAGALALLGILAPAVAGASPAQPGDGPELEGNPQPCWVTDTCPPPVPCDEDPEKECPPVDPCEEDPGAEGCVPPPPPPPPGEDEPDEPTVVVEVDAPVLATPTFTG